MVHLSTVHALHDPRIFYKEVQSLKSAGYDVHLVVQHPRSEVVDGIPVTGLPPTRGRYRRLPLLRRAFQAARMLGAELYHIHDPELIPVAVALKRRTGARVIYDMHEDYRGHGPIEGRVLRALERWCFSRIDHVVIAEDCYAPVVESAGAAYTPILNYFRPPDAAPIAPKTLDEGRFELLYAGVQGEARGLGTLLEVAAHIRRAGLPWRLTLAGVCYVARERHRAEGRIADVGVVLRRAGWAQYLPWDAMTPFFREAHVGLALLAPHPNYLETIPTKFYEYLHYGLPILCSDFPAWRAFVERHGCGAVVAPDDVGAVVAVLKRWASDPATYARLSAAALQAAPRYRWARMEARLLDLYERLLHRPSP